MVCHFILTIAATFGYIAVSWPFMTAIALYVILFFQDRTVYVAYPGMVIMTLGFLSPLILFDSPIALRIPPNGPEYNHDMILSIYWFIGFFGFYISHANRSRNLDLSDIRIGKTDLVPCLAAIIILFFSALMLQDGTLINNGYRDVTEERYGFIEYASLLTLVGFCAARSQLARNILLGCACVYLASAFLVGLRLRFISVSIVVFCCLIGIRISQKWKIWGLLGGFVLFVLGIVRASGFSAINFEKAFSFENQFIRGALVSTPGGAFQTSEFHAYYIEYVSSQQGIHGLNFLFGDILSIFVTRSGLPDAIELKSQAANYFNTPGGGMISGYFYAYAGLFGVIVLSALFVHVFIYVLRREGAQAFPYQVILAAYAPRLLLYDWTIAFKMMFYFFIIKAILSFMVFASRNANPLPPLRVRAFTR